MKDLRLKIGKQGEQIAARALQRAGYKILERNYKTRRGEIDIIAKDGDELVFVEVKARTDLDFGPAYLNVTQKKMQKLTSLANMYLEFHRLRDASCRFDVVSVYIPKEWYRRSQAEIIRNAFDPQPSRRRR